MAADSEPDISWLPDWACLHDSKKHFATENGSIVVLWDSRNAVGVPTELGSTVSLILSAHTTDDTQIILNDSSTDDWRISISLPSVSGCRGAIALREAASLCGTFQCSLLADFARALQQLNEGDKALVAIKVSTKDILEVLGLGHMEELLEEPLFLRLRAAEVAWHVDTSAESKQEQKVSLR